MKNYPQKSEKGSGLPIYELKPWLKLEFPLRYMEQCDKSFEFARIYLPWQHLGEMEDELSFWNSDQKCIHDFIAKIDLQPLWEMNMTTLFVTELFALFVPPAFPRGRTEKVKLPGFHLLQTPHEGC